VRPATTTDGARARAHAAGVFERAADRVAVLPFGRARWWDAEPRHRDLNAVRVDGAPPPDLAARVDEAQAGRPGRFAELEGRGHPPPAGWEADVIAHLRFTGPVPPADPAVQEVGRAALRGLRRRWLLEELPETAGLVAAGDERIFSATPTRGFAVVEDGRAVSMALLVDDGPVQMVEDVYTASPRRGRGLASAVVRTAVRAALDAGATLVHLPADDDGPARRLYERLGFESCAHTTRWVRDPAV
jgi:GNAT superfamily N-acetyltransferase